MLLMGVLEIAFNKPPPPEAKAEVASIIEFLNKDYLKRGSRDPGEGATIESYEWREDSTMTIKLRAGSKVRLDEASLRIKNVLSSILGPKYRLGVRELKLRNIKVLLDGELRLSIRLPFVAKVSVENGRTVIELTDLTEGELKRPLLLRLLRYIEEKEKRARWSGKAEHKILLRRSTEKLHNPRPIDPSKVLEDIGWIKRLHVGQWLFTPPATRLLASIRRLFIDEVLRPLGFEEVVFPKMYPLEVGLKTGHLRGVINSMLFVSLPQSFDIAAYEDLIDYMSVVGEVEPESLQRHLRPPTYFLCFAQCEPFYWFFEEEILDDASLPIKWYDQSGPSFRWESGGIYGIERVIEFHRVEAVWLGKPHQVIEVRNQLLQRYEHFMDNVLDLEWRMLWVTPWFYEQSGTAVEERREVEVDKPGTIDFEAWLPYRGPREDDKSWLEIGNISIHGTKFVEPFRIKHNRSETLWTGCSGFGVERWLVALLAQKGLDPESWPSRFLKYVLQEPFPNSLNTVTYPKTKEGKELLSKVQALFRR